MSLVYLLSEGMGKQFREGLLVQVMLSDELSEQEVLQLKKRLDARPYSKMVTYISKEEAVAIQTEELGEDFMHILDEIPLPASYDLQVLPEYTAPDSIEWVAIEIGKMEGGDEVVYHPVKFKAVNEKMGKISLGLGVLMVLLLIMAIALINNTIRLAVFSKRFIIKSMQLVGATHGFIRRPFIFKGIWLGILSSVLAIGLITGLLYLMKDDFPEVPEIVMRGDEFYMLIGIIVITGIAISWISTHLAVSRFIRLKQDQLY
jgi:cell division transport system permease protein